MGFLASILAFFRLARIKAKERNIRLKKGKDVLRNKLTERRESFKAEEKEKLGVDGHSKWELWKARLLYYGSLIIIFIEVIPIFLNVTMLLLIFMCILIAVNSLTAFLYTVDELPELAIEEKKEDNPTIEGKCVTVTAGLLPYTEADLAARGAKLTDYEKNIYRMGILSLNSVDGYGGGEVGNKAIDKSARVMMIIGKASTETSMEFYSGKEGNLLKDPTTTGANGLGYGFMGINSSKTLVSYVGAKTASKIKAQYKPSTAISYDNKFAPYGVMMATKHFYNEVNQAYTLNWDDKVSKVADEWGIKANKEEFVAYSMAFLGAVRFHSGWNYDSKVGYSGELEGYINFYAAIFSASSDNDSERSFLRWSLPVPSGKPSSGAYSESLFRYTVMGGSGSGIKNEMHLISDPSNRKIGNSNAPKLSLNGKEISEPLWTYLWKKYKDKSGMKKAWSTVQYFSGVSKTGLGDRPLNFHYGFNSLMQAVRVQEMLKTKLVGEAGKSTTNSSSADCDTTDVVAGNFKETPGKGQATINGQTTEKYIESWLKGKSSSVKNHMKKLQQYWGTSSYLASEKSVAKSSGYVDKVFGVPFYGQGSRFGEKYGTTTWQSMVSDTFNYTGCMVYSHAYAASALTGKLINPAEMASLMIASNSLVSAGVAGGNMPNTYKMLGLNAKYIGDAKSNFGDATKPKAVGTDIASTVAKGGVAVVRFTGKPFASGYNHYLVINGVEIKNGKAYYSIYTSYTTDQSKQVYTADYLKSNGMHKDVVLVWK